ncbi:hypothetical protein FAIPA1_200011 [Frankia sp. AiPs1]
MPALGADQVRELVPHHTIAPKAALARAVTAGLGRTALEAAGA